MIVEKIFYDLKDDLQSINEKANERLLKEEQVRSSIYCSLRNQKYTVATERNFNKSSETECDLVFWKGSNPESWMEIKTCWYSENKIDKRRLDKNGNNSWTNKPSEQFKNWKKDIEKLNKIEDSKLSKYFVLVEQCYNVSLFDKLIDNNSYNIKDFFGNIKYDKIEFDLMWNKAPVNKCIVRIFDFKKYN
jgi:hypothetical protein